MCDVNFVCVAIGGAMRCDTARCCVISGSVVAVVAAVLAFTFPLLYHSILNQVSFCSCRHRLGWLRLTPAEHDDSRERKLRTDRLRPTWANLRWSSQLRLRMPSMTPGLWLIRVDLMICVTPATKSVSSPFGHCSNCRSSRALWRTTPGSKLRFRSTSASTCSTWPMRSKCSTTRRNPFSSSSDLTHSSTFN